MNYKESLAWLEATRRFGIKLGLENAQRLFEAIGSPHQSLQFLHIAGTNGKGSTCAFLDAMLRAAGYRTGLYTSPHLVTFRERIRVNGEMISESEVAERLSAIRPHTDRATCFEIITALALDYFRAKQCDMVVLETGLGGRLDATNVVQPLACGITRIGLDHQAWLGNTLTEIAGEKAGIIKRNTPVISAYQSPEVRTVLRMVASEKNAPYTELPFHVPKRTLSLSGMHQQQNAELAYQLLKAANIGISDSVSEEAVRHTTWAGRFQVMQDRIILDGAHNPDAAKVLVNTWKERFGEEKALLIFGGMKDKNLSEVWKCLKEITEEVILTTGEGTRWMPVESLMQTIGIVPMRKTYGIAEALKIARQKSKRILVTGSLYLVGEALSILTNTPQDWMDV